MKLCKSFRGENYQEFQIANLICLWQINPDHSPRKSDPRRILKIGSLQIWRDGYWTWGRYIRRKIRRN